MGNDIQRKEKRCEYRFDDFSLFYKSLQPIIQECLEHYDEGYYEEVN